MYGLACYAKVLICPPEKWELPIWPIVTCELKNILLLIFQDFSFFFFDDSGPFLYFACLPSSFIFSPNYGNFVDFSSETPNYVCLWFVIKITIVHVYQKNNEKKNSPKVNYHVFVWGLSWRGNFLKICLLVCGFSSESMNENKIFVKP